MGTEESLDDKNYDSDALMEVLKSVEDPELKMSVVDLGLIYKIDIRNYDKS